MEITARQMGRIEAACYALAKLTERNEVGTVLVNTIREQLDEIEQTAEPYELNTIPAVRFREARPEPFDAAGTLREQIRDFGRKMLDRGEGLVPMLRALCGLYALTKAELARLLGASRTAVSLALTGREVRPLLLARCAEFFGTDGGAGEAPEKEA